MTGKELRKDVSLTLLKEWSIYKKYSYIISVVKCIDIFFPNVIENKYDTDKFHDHLSRISCCQRIDDISMLYGVHVQYASSY